MKKLILISIILFLCFLKAQGGFEFAQTITLDDAGLNDYTYDLTFGFSPDYTDGFDDGFCSDGLPYSLIQSCEGGCGFEMPDADNQDDCEANGGIWLPPTGNTWTYLDIKAPPAAPPPAFDAALLWNGGRYYKQIVAGLAEDDSVEHVWDIQLQYDTNNTINITWDNTGWADLGGFVLQDAFDGLLGIDIDMTTVDSLTLTNPAFTILKLKVTPSGNSSQISAGFTADVFTGEAPLTVILTDTSTATNNTEITSWDWDFGDENTSTEQNPTHTYAGVGNYTVNLTVSDETGVIKDTVTAENFITVIATPTASFTFEATYLNVSFVDASVVGGGATIIGWLWDFGDGTTSTEQNPVHTYAAPDTYTVSLTVTSEYGSDSVTQSITVEANVTQNPVAGFTYTADYLNVSFTDISETGVGVTITTWLWDFGDGDSSSVQSPVHTYGVPSYPYAYQVSLIVTNDVGLSDTSATQSITVEARPPTAGFTYTMDYVVEESDNDIDYEVTFTNTSVAGDTTIDSWSWDFGDGNTSTDTNATHLYENTGARTVTLTVEDNFGLTDTYTEQITVYVPLPSVPTAGFSATPMSGDAPLTVVFTDSSVEGDTTITSWSWNFDGDGVEDTSGTGPHTYTYTAPGTYQASLFVTDANSLSDTETQEIEVLPVSPTAAFSAIPISGSAPLEVQFTDESTPGSGGIESWLWDFGDGDSSSVQNPTHTYSAPGTYQVRLIVTDEYNSSDTLTKEGYITVIPSVYPGDTDNNGVVNASDVLPLGVHFYLTGPQRSTVGYNWSPSSPDSPWDPIAATYADANGDGIINERDLFGIGVNWDTTHTTGSNKFVVDPSDSELLTLHKPALEKLYQALGGDGEPTRQMKLLLERILGIEHIPDKFYLYQNYPNPFNPSTTIKFDLHDEEYVTLNIFDIGGKLVETLLENEYCIGGTHTFTLQADHLSNGLYFYQITAGKWQSTQKMIILK